MAKMTSLPCVLHSMSHGSLRFVEVERNTTSQIRPRWAQSTF